MYMYICICVFMYICICVFMYICICVFMYICICVFMYGAGRLLINAAMSMSHDTKVHYLDLVVAHGI